MTEWNLPPSDEITGKMPVLQGRGKASDGGDLGVRYTPEMIEMCKLAFALRARGIIKF